MVFLGWLATASNGLAQQEASGRPAKLPDVLENSSIEPQAFYFLDEAGNRVVITDMTFEEIDRARSAQSGALQPEKPYSFERITVTGTADGQRAELGITFKLKVTPPAGSRIAIPLRMSGFHPQGPFDVIGVEDYRVDYSVPAGGNLLWIKADQPRDVEVTVRAVSRVSTDAGGGLEFDLPTAPTSVDLSLRGDDLDATVVGRGDEVVETSEGEPGSTRVRVECNGGGFSLRWRARDGRRPSDQVLEVDSRLRVAWDDVDSPPSVRVELDVSNRRGSLAPFDLRIPAGAEIIEPLPSAAGFELAVRDAEAGLIQVMPDDGEQSSRLQIALEYRLPSGNYGPEDPLTLNPVDVPAAVRQRGEIEVRTDRSFRLRWMQTNAVRSAWRTATADTPDARVYLFQYDRVPFELPVWLSAKQQPLRVEQQYTVRVSESAATLEAEISATGTVIEGLPLVVKTVGWETVEVSDLESGRSLDDPFSDREGELALELGELTPALNGKVGVRWTAARRIEPAKGETVVEFPLPDVQVVDARAVIISPGELAVQTAEGYSLVSDLVASQGLVRIPADSEPLADRQTLRYRMQSVGQSPVYRGYLKESPPEASIAATVEMTADRRRLRITNQWLVTPRGSLRGQLPVDNLGAEAAILYDRLAATAGEADADPDAEAADRTLADGQPRWQIAVNGQPAVLRPGLEETGQANSAVIYSDRLNDQPCRVEIVGSIPLELEGSGEASSTREERVQLRLPRPAMNGGVSAGSVRLRLVESPGLRLTVTKDGVPVDQPVDLAGSASWVASVQSRVTQTARAPMVQRTLVRTEAGRERRYDRLVARVIGGAARLTVEYDAGREEVLEALNSEETLVQVLVDGQPVDNVDRTVRGLEIPLQGESSNHLVDVRVWSARATNGPATRLTPRLRLPLSTGKTYWDLVLAYDRHLIGVGSGSSQLMAWQYDRFLVRRVPTRSYADLLSGLGAPRPGEPHRGNRYLLVTSDPASLRTYEAGRPLLWMMIAGVVLAGAAALVYFPAMRHPMTVVAAACALAGLAWVTPDLAVMTGQVVLVAMILVAALMGTRAILMRRPRATVLGGLSEGSSMHTSSARRGGSQAPEPKSTQTQEPMPSGSAAGVQP